MYRFFARILWFVIKLVGRVAVLALKLVAPRVARRLAARLRDSEPRDLGDGPNPAGLARSRA